MSNAIITLNDTEIGEVAGGIHWKTVVTGLGIGLIGAGALALAPVLGTIAGVSAIAVSGISVSGAVAAAGGSALVAIGIAI